MKVVGAALFTGLFLSGSCFGYQYAKCKGEVDTELTHMCCAEPGNPGNSVWSPDAAGASHCDAGQRDNCGAGTHLWSNQNYKLLSETMADDCRKHHYKRGPVFH